MIAWAAAMSIDHIERLGGSVLQHGAENDRIYLMKLDPADLPAIIPELDALAERRGYSKIFAKVPHRHADSFVKSGYEIEGAIPGFFREGEAGAFLGKYFSRQRREESRPDLVRQVLEAARDKAGQIPGALPQGCLCRVAGPADTEQMAGLYREVFLSYPFPIQDPDYLARTMEENLIYFGIWQGAQLLALSSAEMDIAAGNAEMTDFATRPECRGMGLASFLLSRMEEAMAQRGIRTLYTIARAYSFGMNISFARQGYAFGGTLTHNTQISGALESMNLWYRGL